MTTHVCLVSSQPTPNLTPLLDPATAPERIILVVSPDMKRRADWLTAVIQPRGIKVETWPIEDPWDIEGIESLMTDLIGRESAEVERKSLILNATGGTKPMSIAAFGVFRAFDLPVIYVHPEEDRLIHLFPSGHGVHELQDRIKLGPFLMAHGVSVSASRPPRTNVPEPWRIELAAEIIGYIDRYGGPLRQLNYLAGGAAGTLRSDSIRDDSGAFTDLVELFAHNRCLTRAGDILQFRDEEERQFVNGGWIEGYVFDAVRDLRRGDPHIQDLAYAVNVEREQRERHIPNELDVVFLRNNRLHIIECKTKRYSGNDAGADSLYKLDSLRDLVGGLQAKAMLVSFSELPAHDKTRAADLGISVCAGIQLRQLKDSLRQFIG